MRLSRSTFAPANAFWEGEESSTVVTLTASADQHRACRVQGLAADPMRIRLVRVRLKGGETQVLATSILDEQRLPTRLFSPLYRRRWGVEEHYKRQKRWAEIENLSGRSVLAVRQDIHAKILAMNLAGMVRNLAQFVATRRFAQRSFAYPARGCNAPSVMKNNLVRLLIADPIDRPGG
jgi:hypothetical protein